MRSVSWAALLVPLLFLSLPAVARERTVERVSRKRTVHVSATPGEARSELLVAGGTATVITADIPLGPGGPRLQDERGLVRLVPVDGSSFIVLPSTDIPEGEHLPLIVPLRSGDSLQLALVTRHGEVDGEVRLVRLQAPAAGGEGVVGVARLLNNAAPEGQVGLALPGKRVYLREDIHAEVESVLRIGQHVFITLSTSSGWKSKPSARDWNRLQLRAALGDGSSVVLPLLHVPAPSSMSHAPRHTLVTILPGATLHVELAVAGSDAPKTVLMLPLGAARTTP
ncbi:DUF2381 family protein [Archangium sp.]|uniref:DUF2381 family protein n=1 Tax=Archangium sp. TaxID=1872627 RepID=UPI002D4C1CA9|nr:DUF2381 family protein [Archangium sp.]HYO54002.1 DUF2381 family protein [Archangium sp.]